ncbi:MAG: hypothetical protein SPJ27_07615 [Candidatus Onthovivens sp.]|nr:hypothetical protein [Candidatus Onthovivens sp.]
MIICLASLEFSTGLKCIYEQIDDHYLKFGLVSFYYLKNQQELEQILTKVDYLLIDSGAHSFQHGTKVNFDEYTHLYANFIKRNTDNKRILGFFEMDIDNVVGYEKVLEYRKVLEKVSDKIIPVWHNNRGVDEFIKMCEEHRGKRIAITGFANNDITDGQYNLFINEAHKHNCYIHILGLTRFDLIKELNLGLYDSVDSSSWKQTGIYGGLDVVKKKFNLNRLSCFEGLRNVHYSNFLSLNFEAAKRIQDNYLNIDNSIKKEELN